MSGKSLDFRFWESLYSIDSCIIGLMFLFRGIFIDVGFGYNFIDLGGIVLLGL